MLGSTLTWLFYKDHFAQTTDKGLVLAVFATQPAIRKYNSNLICEAIGTFVLIFSIFYITGAELSEPKTPIGLGAVGAIPVAFLVWVIGLSLGGTTGYAINPARDFGPRLIHHVLPLKHKGNSDWAYAWVPIVGPLIGASLAALLYLQLG
ncbi:putative glycerol uptake facilitator protein [compost metagenome]